MMFSNIINESLNMKDKYQLTKQQNIFLAKKLWDENVYCGMKMENRNVTFPQTKTILEGINVPNVALDDIQAILNMGDAWKYLMNSFDEEVSIRYRVGCVKKWNSWHIRC